VFETRLLIFRKEYILREFNNSVMRRLTCSREEEMESWNCLIHSFISSPKYVYVAMKGGRKNVKYSVGENGKSILRPRHRQDLE